MAFAFLVILQHPTLSGRSGGAERRVPNGPKNLYEANVLGEIHRFALNDKLLLAYVKQELTHAPFLSFRVPEGPKNL